MDAYLSKPIRQQEFDELLEKYAQALERAPEEHTMETANAGTAAATRVPGEPPGEQVIDFAGAMLFVAGDDQMLKELCGLFLEQSPTMCAKIGQAVTDKDARALQRAAHTLKGAAGALCAVRTVKVAQQLESLGQNQNLGQAEAALPVLDRELTALHTAIRSLIEAP